MKPPPSWAILPTQIKTALIGNKSKCFDFFPQQKVWISQEFSGIGCLLIFLVNGKEPQQGGGRIASILIYSMSLIF